MGPELAFVRSVIGRSVGLTRALLVPVAIVFIAYLVAGDFLQFPQPVLDSGIGVYWDLVSRSSRTTPRITTMALSGRTR